MKKQPRGKFDRAKVVHAKDAALPEKLHRKVVDQTNTAEDECRINFRWGTAQLEIVKQVADLMGISYQQYIKQVLYRQAHADLQQFSNNKIAEPPNKYRTKKS